MVYQIDDSHNSLHTVASATESSDILFNFLFTLYIVYLNS